MAAKLRVEPVETEEALRALGPEWRKLFEESHVALPFATFEWAEVWWKYMRRERRTVRDYLHLRALRNETGRLVAVAPLIRTERPAGGPFRIRQLQFLGADPNMTEIRGMIALPEYEQQAYTALLEDLQSQQWDWVRWSGIREDNPAEPLVQPELTRCYDPIPDFLLTLPATWEEFRAGLKRNIRESLRKCYNSLRRDGIDFTFQIAQRPEEIAPALERFFVLHAARSLTPSSVASVAHANVFAAPETREFLREFCARLGAEDRVRVFQLVIQDTVIATRIGFLFGDTLYLYYSGYDPAWAKYSVMTTAVAEAIQYAIGVGVKTINLSTGRDISKTRWGAEEVNYREGVQIAPTGRSRIAYEAYLRRFQTRDQRLSRLMTG